MSEEVKPSVNVEQINIEEELETSYLAYSLSVIVGRALPDVRDGLKPVHRRILYAMTKIGCDKMTKKSARIVGDVIGKYHPHGDSAAYDALVRLAQPWNMRYCLVDGQGNFGNEDGDKAAAQRYTEAKLAKLSTNVLCDLDKDTVDFIPNFDGEETEPVVLATKVPLLLVNGSNGIAVGMATNIPPHNLTEVCDGFIHLIQNPDCTTRDLMQFIKGPDFPTYGTIHGRRGIFEAYETGRGKIQVRARVDEDVVHGHNALIIREIPYQVNKMQLVEQISHLAKTKAIEGITDIRDESGRGEIRVVIELRKDAPPQVILNQLYKQSQLQSTFGIIMLAIVNNRPMVLPLKDVMSYFIDFRRDVIVRRTIYLVRRARERAHILEGYRLALDHLDEVISIIRNSEDANIARDRLIERFSFSEMQTKSILELRLQRLTGMERDKILNELAQLLREIQDYEAILKSKERIDEIITQEFSEIKALYGDARRTEIVDDGIAFEDGDLIAEEYCMVMRTQQNYIKRQALSEYQAQKRGGQGKKGMGTKEDDYVRDMFLASSHQRILIFTSMGRVFMLKVYAIPQGSRTTKGRPIINMLPKLEPNESVETILPLPEGEPRGHIVMATQNGLIKKIECVQFKNIRKNGLRALTFREGDRLIDARLLDDHDTVILMSARGLAVHFDPSKLRALGRTSMGVRGMKLRDDDHVAAMVVVHDPDGLLLTVTENGYGKRTPIREHAVKGRGGIGLRAINTTERNGHVVGALIVQDDEHLLLATNAGKIIRTRVNEIRITGRGASGVKLMNTGADEHVVAVAAFSDSADDEGDITPLPVDDAPEDHEVALEEEGFEDELEDELGDELGDEDSADEDE